MAVESALLAALLLLVVALLRSHAEILRRLAELSGSSTSRSAPGASRADARLPTREIVGETLAGDTVRISLVGGASRTLLAFLSSGCSACERLWRERPTDAARDVRLVVVTKGSERESPARLAELALDPKGVVMSQAAWEAFAVPVTPYFVLIDGERETVLGEGSVTSWQQLGSLVRDGDGDARRARSTSERAERAERALAVAGIVAGHPSLYPSRAGSPELGWTAAGPDVGAGAAPSESSGGALS